ncbi:hypothetical protein, partial [Variovorax sp. GB1P17]|uniref:hypothetical protein n=1 Tax=Variovorax sp. GB1P17 TaxID=3443740 RepID=UPI003F449391
HGDHLESLLKFSAGQWNTLVNIGSALCGLAGQDCVGTNRMASRGENPAIAAWWPRLFNASATQDGETLQSTRDLYGHAINSLGGRLTQAVLLDIQTHQQSGDTIDKSLFDAIETAAAAHGRQGAYARAALVHAAGFLVNIKAEKVVQILDAALRKDSGEAAALRSILVSDARLSSSASAVFHEHILRGVLEIGDDRRAAKGAAAKLIAPALSIVRHESDASQWGITTANAAHCLRVGPPSLREGAAALLKEWISQIEGGPAQAWRDGIRPLLDEVWPRERSLREKRQTSHFAALAVATGNAFPEALEWILPYLGPSDTHGISYEIEKSRAPEDFPQETLTLLWRLLGGKTNDQLVGTSKILDRLVVASPRMEVDRRLQSLYQRAVHYN